MPSVAQLLFSWWFLMVGCRCYEITDTYSRNLFVLHDKRRHTDKMQKWWAGERPVHFGAPILQAFLC